MPYQDTQPAAPRNSDMRSWQIGDVTVTKLVESEMAAPIDVFFEGATTEALQAIDWLQPDFVTPEGLATLSIHALIIDTPTKRIIVDTCIGNDKDRTMAGWNHLQLPFLADLEAAGFSRDSFDIVLCTHLHVDHVGWNTILIDGQWVPTFPKARYLLNRTEYEYWGRDEGVFTGGGFDVGQREAFSDSVRPVMDAGQVDLVEGIHEVCEEIFLFPTVGHSPGHVSIAIRSRGQNALITGDMTHHPSQLAHLDWGLAIDYDGAQAIRTRKQVFADVADRDVLVIGTHWAGATAGKILRDGAVYRLEI